MIENYHKFQGRCLRLTSSSEALEELNKVGVDPYGIEAMLPKMINLNILLEGIECKIANVIKQEMLSIGGDAAVARESVSCSISKTDVIIMGTIKQIERFTNKISNQPFGLNSLSIAIKQIILNITKASFYLKTWKREIFFGDRTWIMGILNVTPDSFSDGGRFITTDDAIAHGVQMVNDGADIIDIGGESSRPGAQSVSLAEEMGRVIPIIKGLADRIDVPISIDTTKAEVAQNAIKCGAEIVNDISAMRFDGQMSKVVKDLGAAVILMHMRRKPQDMQQGDLFYPSIRGDIINFLRERIEISLSFGIELDRIIIDPGLGFGKTPEDNLKLLKYLPEFRILGVPIVIGASRKSFIGYITGGDVLDRLEGTAAAVTIAIMNGANIIRVHDVKFIKRVAIMADAVNKVQ